MSASTEMKDALNLYLDAICDDYAKWMSRVNAPERAEKIDAFEEGISYDVGSKYIRVTTGPRGQESVHSFIVNTHSDKKFPYGSILKAASWKAPARNFGRGNVFEDVSHIQWTGAF